MILTGFIAIDLCMEVGKARNYCNTTASNSIRNTDKHGALPVRHRVLFALPKPKACSALGADGKVKGRRLSLATWIPRYLMMIRNGRISYPEFKMNSHNKNWDNAKDITLSSLFMDSLTMINRRAQGTTSRACPAHPHNPKLQTPRSVYKLYDIWRW